MVAALALMVAPAASAFAAAPSQSVASGSDLTWGYGYARSRVSVVPPAYNALGGVSQVAGPWVVPAPIAGYHSQSTPVVDGNRIFFFAFHCPGVACTTSTTAALFESDFGANGAPGPAREIASFQPSTNTNYASPSDPAISPGGHWLAFAAGPNIYWWPITATGVGQEESGPITPNNPALRDLPTTVGSSPVFIPDAQPGSGGWAVCSGDSVGAFACYSVGGGGLQTITTSVGAYLTRSATTAITSSAVYVPSGVAGHPADTTCFGVASWSRSRIECLNPFGSGHLALGVGYYKSPIDSALAYAGGDLWATGQNGGLYALSARTGVPAGADQGYDTQGMSIAPPSVDVLDGANVAAVVQDHYDRLCLVGAGAPGQTIPYCLPQGDYIGQLTAPTLIPGTQARCDNIWDNTNSGRLFEVQACQRTFDKARSGQTGMGDGHNFSALDVGVGPGSQYVVAWSDQAVPWEQDGGATLVGSVPPFEGQPSPGGLEIWHLRTPLDVWPLEPSAPAGGTECILAASYQGGMSSITVTWDGKQYAMTPVETVPPANTKGPSISPISGCTVPAQYRDNPNPLWKALSKEWPKGLATGNVPPSQWGTTSWTTQVWVARVPVPTTPPSKPVPAAVTAIEAVSHTPYMPGPLHVSVVCTGATGAAASSCQAGRAFGIAAFLPTPSTVGGVPTSMVVIVPSWASYIGVYTPGAPGTGTLGATGAALTASGGGTGPLFTVDGVTTPCSASPPTTSLAQRIRGLLAGQTECGSSFYTPLSAAKISGSVSVVLPPGVSSVEGLGGRAYKMFVANVGTPSVAGAVQWMVDVYAGSSVIEVLRPTEYSVCPSPSVPLSGGVCGAPPGPPTPPNGQCVGTCSGVPGQPARCGGTYSDVPGCLPPGCGVAGMPTCAVYDQLWNACASRADRCVWPVIDGPVGPGDAVARRPPGAPAQYIGGTPGYDPHIASVSGAGAGTGAGAAGGIGACSAYYQSLGEC